MPDTAINLQAKLSGFSEHWSPRVVAEMNDYQFKLAKLQGAFVKALRAPAVQQKLSDMGYQVVGNTPAQFRKIVQDSSQRYGELLSTGAVKLQ